MAQWNKIGSRGRVDDRRAMRMSPIMAGGGIGTLVLLMGITYLMGGNPLEVLLQAGSSGSQTQPSASQIAEYEGEDDYEIFASTVLGSNNEYWDRELARYDISYKQPTLVLFRGSTTSGCGGALSYAGPHYCPLDQTIYLDETFFEDLQRKFGAEGGDVAEAYVIGHEVAHHVQHSIGNLQSGGENTQSIAVELQADCFAGLWANSLSDRNIFARGEIQEAMDAAAAVGDDRIQKQSTGRVSPESWTHGSSDQRVEAFTSGYRDGDISTCLAYTDT